MASLSNAPRHSCHSHTSSAMPSSQKFLAFSSPNELWRKVFQLPFRIQQHSFRLTSSRSDSEKLEKSQPKSTRQRSRKQELKRQALASYRDRFAKALRAEMNEEMQEMKERLRHWSKQQLGSEGLALFDLSARLEGNLFRDKIIRFFSSCGNGVLPPHNQFSQGDTVFISRKNPMDEGENVVEGVVMERARRFIRVAISANHSKYLSLHTKWRLDLSANQVAYERCLSAIEAFSSSQEPDRVFVSLPSSVQASIRLARQTSDESTSLGEGAMAIRGLIMETEADKLKSQKFSEGGDAEINCKDDNRSTAANSHGNYERVKLANNPPSQIGGKSLGTLKGSIRSYLREMQGKLNRSQEIAIEAAACQRVTLWQGPPGTGKTKTLVNLIFALSRSRHGKVIACADSNVAVDNLVEGLLDLGLRVARIGQPVKVKEELRESTIEAQVLAHPLMKRSAELKNMAVMRRQEARNIKNNRRRAVTAKEASSIWDDAGQLEAKALKDVLDRVEVVAATCIGAGDTILDNQSFCVCVIDEATQATEPASLVPILRSGADCVVLVGDPAQLPPTVLCLEAAEAGLAISLFEHLQDCGLKPYLLDTQYRMHPSIAALPSSLFYFGRLKSHPSPSERLAPKGFKWPSEDKPMVFIDCVDGKEETTSEGNSWLNYSEALQAVKIVELLVHGNDIDGGCEGIGVIAPYRAQVRLLYDMLFPGDIDRKEKFAGLEVKTVDGFQGREKEAIIFCTVRSNNEGRLGFLTDQRRMNVALTRAKRGLVVIGNSKTLEFHETWATWLNEMRKEKLFFVASSLGES